MVLKLHMVLEDVITSLTSKNQHLDFNVLRLWRRVNYRNPKPDWRRNWFGKRKITGHSNPTLCLSILKQTSVYKGYKQDKIEMRGDRAEMSDFPLYLNTVAGGLDRRYQTIGGFSFVVKIYAVPVVEIIG